MNKIEIRLLITIALLLPLGLVSAQKKDKAWSEWSKKDAQKMLNDSPWAQTQTDTDTSQRLYSRTADLNLSRDSASAGTTARLGRGAVNQEINIRFRVRFFSARPIRQAHARLIKIDQNPSGEVLTKLQDFAELKAVRSIIVTASFDSNDAGYLGAMIKAFDTGTTNILKNKTYLERSDGKRLFLEQYVPPGRDGFGARFVFPRQTNGVAFLDRNSGVVRFHAEYPVGIQIDRRFKVADMVYNGELEY
jgi:hypothetical protein